MKIGKSVGPIFDPKVVFNDCVASLNAIHKKGFVHGDIRMPNILLFGKTYSLIDFGEAASIHATMSVSLENISTCRRNKGPLEFLEVKSKVSWTPKHDFEMLARAVFDIPILADGQQQDNRKRYGVVVTSNVVKSSKRRKHER